MMCYGCWEEMGRPSIIDADTIAAAKLIAAVYQFSEVGGQCHIVVDDWNIETEHVQWCLDHLDSTDVMVEQADAERKCLVALLALSDEGRASALAIHDGFLDVPPVAESVAERPNGASP